MKIYLDDVRLPQDPEWELCKTADEVIELLKLGTVTHMSLDHDLGDGAGTGMDVLTWLEEEVALHGFIPPLITVHSANPYANPRMWAVVKRIEAMAAGRQEVN